MRTLAVRGGVGRCQGWTERLFLSPLEGFDARRLRTRVRVGGVAFVRVFDAAIHEAINRTNLGIRTRECYTRVL